jgi:lipopolysaccharide export system protein LptA
VTINQQDNTVAINGDGAMQMPSGSNFDGTKTAGPATLKVFWNKAMYFNGNLAVYEGNVTATQEKSKLLCQTLHVYLDKMVSLREGDKKGQGAKMERLVSSGKVHIDDEKRDDKNQFVRQDRLVCTQVTMDNRSDDTNALGPGQVESMQLGSPDLDDSGPKKTQQPQQMYVTRVIYQGRLASKKYADKRQKATFWTNVEVYHFPAEDINTPMTPEKMPKGGTYLSCNELTVASKPGPDGKVTQTMHAHGNVFFQNSDGKGKAPDMYYNQETGQLILKGTVGNRAIIQRSGTNEILQANDILYIRKTGQFTSSGVPSIEGFLK